MELIFNESYMQIIKDNQNIDSFIEVLDGKFNKFIDEREEQIRTPFEVMIADYRQSLETYKHSLY